MIPAGNPAVAPLLGTNLVRLLYLDEAGTNRDASWLCVAGILVHGDFEWPEVERRMLALIEKYVPEDKREDFHFHATDIFHGSGIFDRRSDRWRDPRSRMEVLNDLAKIIDDLSLPVVLGKYQRNTFHTHFTLGFLGPRYANRMMHQLSAMDCLIHADRWLARYAPTELATVVHESGGDAKVVFLYGRGDYFDIFFPETKGHWLDWCVMYQKLETNQLPSRVRYVTD